MNFNLTSESPRANQPQNISINLKPHQLASLYRMTELDTNCGLDIDGYKIHSNIGILADLAGYGKTLTFLALIESQKDTTQKCMPINTSYFSQYHYGINISKDINRNLLSNTTLIVVPNNLINHWTTHLDTYTKLHYEIINKKNITKVIIQDYDIIICPATFYNPFTKEHTDIYWNRIAFDEADSINIPNTNVSNGRFLWLITATCDNIPYRTNKGFLKNLFKPFGHWNATINSFFQTVIIRGDDVFVKNSFKLIEPQINYIQCLTPIFINAIRSHISNHVLELVNAGDINGAITALGGTVDNDRNIIELVTRNIKNEITTVRSQLNTISVLDISLEERERETTRLTEKLLFLQNREESLKKSINEALETNCTICYDILQQPTIIPCCNNMFCAECLIEWMKLSTTCPLCRGTFDKNKLCTIGDNNNKSLIKNDGKKPKLQTLIDIIKKNPSGKFIVFSCYMDTFIDIGRSLDNENIRYGVPTTALRTESVLKKLKDGELSVILLNTKYNGAGIEIPIATDVIIYHQMNTASEIQAIARAQRPGRTGQLRVWKLQYDGEM